MEVAVRKYHQLSAWDAVAVHRRPRWDCAVYLVEGGEPDFADCYPPLSLVARCCDSCAAGAASSLATDGLDE